MTAGRTNGEALSREWGTPRKYADAVERFFGGPADLDPCSNCHSIINATVEYGLPDTDGLNTSWDFPTIFVNPPHGRDRQRGTGIRDWLARCARAHAEHGSEVLALAPVATNTSHWKAFVFGAAAGIAFLYDTRLRFLAEGRDDGKGAPMACAIIYWGKRYGRFQRVFLRFGAVADMRGLFGEKIGSACPAARTRLSSAVQPSQPVRC